MSASCSFIEMGFPEICDEPTPAAGDNYTATTQLAEGRLTERNRFYKRRRRPQEQEQAQAAAAGGRRQNWREPQRESRGREPRGRDQMTRKDERAEDMPGGIREEEPEEEDAAGAAGERHQSGPRRGSRRMLMTQRTTGGGARDGPAMNLDPPVNPPAWAILNIGAADSVLFPCSTLRTSEPVNIQNITRSKIGWRAGVMGESHGKRNPRERPATRFGHPQGPMTTYVTTTKSPSCKHPHAKVRLERELE